MVSRHPRFTSFHTFPAVCELEIGHAYCLCTWSYQWRTCPPPCGGEASTLQTQLLPAIHLGVQGTIPHHSSWGGAGGRPGNEKEEEGLTGWRLMRQRCRCGAPDSPSPEQEKVTWISAPGNRLNENPRFLRQVTGV